MNTMGLNFTGPLYWVSCFLFFFLTVVNATELCSPVMIGWIHGYGMDTKGQL